MDRPDRLGGRIIHLHLHGIVLPEKQAYQEGREPNRNRWLGAEPNANRCEPEPEWIFLNRNRHEPEPDLFLDPLICFEAIIAIF